MHFLRLFALAVFFPLMAAGPAARDFSVQVIDMGNTGQAVSLTAAREDRHSWFVTEAGIDPLKFSSERLRGEKRSEQIPQGFHSVTVPDNLGKVFAGKSRPKTVWYYKAFIAPSNPRSTLAIRLGKISDTDETFLNGVLIGKSGDADRANDHAWDKIRIYDIPATLLKPLEKNILLVKVQTYFDTEYGIISDRVEIGDSAAMNRELIAADLTALGFLACYMTFGIYFLFLYIRRPSEKAYPLFFAFISMLVLYQFLQSQVKYFVSGNFLLLKRIEYTALLTMFPAFYFYLRQFFRISAVPFFRYVHYAVLASLVINAGCLAIVFATPDVPTWAKYNERFHLQAAMPFYLIVCLSIVVYRIFKRDRDARIIIGGLLCLVLTLVVDNLVYYGIINIPRISSYVIFLFLVSLALILANQFVRVHNEVEELNKNLEQKVEERTRELSDTLQRVQDLKAQQDGDYFLTSLLIEPLSANRVSSQRTQVEFYVKEKKEFSFRRWHREIGGDMCVAHTIELRGRHFTVALNADAMGKSMQGAGGALVLGSVFASIIERTRSAVSARDMAPETWLKEAFYELHRVFESFDGSMLVSVVMAAIDDEAGVMYYINAEHPWTVLYRDGKAAFTEQEIALRKLGTLGVNATVEVKVYYLEDGDVVIMGSDGRDDLILGMDTEGQRIINEDETLFLRHVEKARGQLEPLAAELKAAGELSDDLSFIRIAYTAPATRKQPIHLAESQAIEDFKLDLKRRANPLTIADMDAILTEQGANVTTMHHAIRWLYQLKQYGKGAEWAERFVASYPTESEFLYLAGFGYKLTGEYDKALDFAERLLARTIMHEKNLVNLIDLQLIRGRTEEANATLALLVRHYPHNGKLPRLTEAVTAATGATA